MGYARYIRAIFSRLVNTCTPLITACLTLINTPSPSSEFRPPSQIISHNSGYLQLIRAVRYSKSCATLTNAGATTQEHLCVAGREMFSLASLD